ncbi:MAG: T9SS type A sorting domain-containing protein, partial [Ignavibacteria bacterium]|nr:T9SS type A sorting domain-containing protein [Ignavibacteria bacterium]
NTTNSGDSWINQSSGLNKTLNKVQFIDSKTGWILAGDTGVILRTTNGGVSWLRSFIGYQFGLITFYFSDKNTGWAVGGGIGNMGLLYKTADGGVSWNTIYQNSGYLRSVYFADNNTGWTTGSRFDYNWGTIYARILKTKNGGVTWTDQLGSMDLPYVDLNSVYFIDNNTGWVSGSGGYILRTTNGGTDWGYLHSGTSSNLYSIRFLNKKNGWVLGSDYYNTFVLVTTNGGQSWTKKSCGTGNSLTSVFFTDKNTGWVTGSNGTILKTTTGGNEYLPSEIPSGYSLNQNYPNPFNPVTNLEFGIPDLGFVTLKIYDILGKEIKTLINENLNPGKYEIVFNGSGLPSGVYFYKLTAGDFTDTKRMMLIK